MFFSSNRSTQHLYFALFNPGCIMFCCMNRRTIYYDITWLNNVNHDGVMGSNIFNCFQLCHFSQIMYQFVKRPSLHGYKMTYLITALSCIWSGSHEEHSSLLPETNFQLVHWSFDKIFFVCLVHLFNTYILGIFLFFLLSLMLSSHGNKEHHSFLIICIYNLIDGCYYGWMILYILYKFHLLLLT